jgi:light-harvesting complex I chlorophyll a/b binding protein 4
MSGQDHLSLEAAQSIAAHNARNDGLGKRNLALGLAGLMLMGVATWGALPRDGHADSRHPHPYTEVAFNPGMSGFKTKGFRAATRDPVAVMMNAVQGVDGTVSEPFPVDEAAAFDPYDPLSKQQVTSKAMSLAKRLPGSVGSPMSLLATTALVSGGNPGQLASVFAVMPEEDVEKVEALKVDVLAKAKSMPGVTGPLDFFDPMGFCTDCSDGKLCFYREVEVKHGRVAMLASLGFIVGENFHPLFGGNIDVPSYLAFQQTPLQTFWPAVVAAIAIPELFSVFTFNEPFYNDAGEKVDDPNDSPLWTVKTDRVGGDFGWDPMGLRPTDPKEFKEMQTKELNTGRLAMIAAAGMVAQELASGKKLFLTTQTLLPLSTNFR